VSEVQTEVLNFLPHAVSSSAFTVVTLSINMMVVIAAIAIVISVIIMSVTTLELIVMLVSSHSMLMRVLLINLATFAFIEEVVWLIIVKVKVPTKMYIRR